MLIGVRVNVLVLDLYCGTFKWAFMVRYLLILFGLMLFFQSHAQLGLTTKSSKAKKYYNMALQKYKAGKVDVALSILNKCEKYDNNFVELWLLRGDINHEKKDRLAEIKSFRRAISIDPDFFPNVHFLLGELLLVEGCYKDALFAYQQFLGYSNISAEKRKKAEKAIRNCKYVIESRESSKKNEIFPLVSVNTKDDEYWPFVSASGKEFFFTRKWGKGKYENEDIFKGEKEEYGCLKKENIGDVGLGKDVRVEIKDSVFKCLWKNISPLSFNTSLNEGNVSMTADGKVIYFGACDRDDGYGSFDIYMSIKKGDKWSKPVNIGEPINTSSWESQPSISPDGGSLYFASNRPGGKGLSDIWVSSLIENLPCGKQIWSEPQSLSFNTDEHDMAPFVYFDSSTLFFSSEGLPGMGGFDIYRVEKKDNKWGMPVNIGVNDEFDNIGFALSPNGVTAYFSSMTLKGDKDIFYFDISTNINMVPIVYLYGDIVDKVSGKSIKSQMQITKYGGNGKTECLYNKKIDKDYSLCLLCKEVFCMNVIAKGYEFYSEKIILSDSLNFSSIKRNILLQPISLDSKICLSNIYFDFDSYLLNDKSFCELQCLKQYLLLNKNIKVEIGGHTDYKGSVEYNKSLSERRARQVYEYLVDSGISKERLRFKGYGSSVPIDEGKTEVARQRNRRTEIKVIEIVGG